MFYFRTAFASKSQPNQSLRCSSLNENFLNFRFEASDTLLENYCELQIQNKINKKNFQNRFSRLRMRQTFIRQIDEIDQSFCWLKSVKTVRICIEISFRFIAGLSHPVISRWIGLK